jgi:hypothetical protein
MASKFEHNHMSVKMEGQAPVEIDRLCGLLAIPYFSDKDDTGSTPDLIIINMSPQDIQEHAAWLFKIAKVISDGGRAEDVPPPWAAVQAMDKKGLREQLVPPEKAVKAYRKLPTIDGKRRFR